MTVPEGLAPWQLSTADYQIRPAGDGEFSLFVGSGGFHRIIIPGPFDPARFTQIAVRGIFRANYRIRVALDAEGSKPLSPPGMASLNRRDEQVVHFELPQLRRRRKPIDRIRVEIEGLARGFEIHSVELLHVPLELELPDPVGEPALIDVGGISQRGVGIATERPLVTELDVQPGDRLQFAYGIPILLRFQGLEPVLELVLESESGARKQGTYEFDEVRKRWTTWHEVSLSLEAFEGERVRAVFTLRPHRSGTPAVSAIANLRLTRPSASPRTLLLVTSDTHRADHIAASGLGVHVLTPILDALAERGVYFEDCYSSTNVTTPSHVSLMTGVHPRDTRVLSNTTRTSEDAHTLAEIFREQGWATYGVVSVRHLGPNGFGLGQGFDRMAGPTRGTFKADEAIDILLDWTERADGRPLFAWLHLFDAHAPYSPPERFERLYYPADKDPYDPALPALDITEGRIPVDLASVRDIEYLLAQYRAEISYIDEQLGRVLDHPRFRESVVAVTADHGEVLQKDGSYFNHAGLFPDTLHIPLILAWPGAPSGARVSAPVVQTDLGRTLLDLAGMAAVDFPGRNLLADLEGGPPPEPRYALAANSNSASIMIGDWFLVLHLRDHGLPLRVPRLRHSVDLYRLSTDPECLRNVAEEAPETARQLRARLVEWLGQSSPTGLATAASVSSRAMSELAALGYATGEEEVRAEDAWIDPACGCVFCSVFE
ncbi:MAG: hypothetical protein E2O39_15705 [Planctomycetota bacterium]|nr:MAG: hypothetical protein E2O39_15705 [Planctomycetota bacterium]